MDNYKLTVENGVITNIDFADLNGASNEAELKESLIGFDL